MTEKFSKTKTELFERFVKSLSLALTNGALYPPNHPAFVSSLDSLKGILDKWFASEGPLEVGISSDNLLLSGIFIREGSDLYGKVAEYLHKKGLVAISFHNGIGTQELLKFVTFLKNDAKVIAEKGGIVKNIGTMPHILIKELDYSSLLTSARATDGIDENSFWRSLSGMKEDLKKGYLPRYKSEFMSGFLKDPGKAAALLNKIYREALVRMDDKAITDEMKAVFSEMSRYIKKHSADSVDNAKNGLLNVISHLDADLILSLFTDKDAGPDLAGELFKSSTEEMTADFIASVMQNANDVSEKMIKLFSRLVSEPGKSARVLPIVADKLLKKERTSPGSLKTLEGSIKDLFQNHPEDNFASQIYNLTIGAFLEKEKAPEAAAGKYSALVDGYKEFLKEDNLKKEKVRLLLNVLWLEHDGVKFKRMSDVLADYFSEVLNPKYIKITKEAFELLVEKLSHEQMSNKVIAAAVEEILHKISELETIDRLISFIPGSERETLDEIVYMLISSKKHGVILDAVIRERDPENKKKILAALIKAGDASMLKVLFEKAGRQGLFKNRLLLDLVVLCGVFKVKESVKFIGDALATKPFINIGPARELRIQSALSLGRIGTREAIEIVKSAVNDRDDSVRAVCSMVLESENIGSGKAI